MPWLKRFKCNCWVKLSVDLDFAKVSMEAAAENVEEAVSVQS
jgi:hypothetical protein